MFEICSKLTITSSELLQLCLVIYVAIYLTKINLKHRSCVSILDFEEVYGSRYSRMDQVKFVEDIL